MGLVVSHPRFQRVPEPDRWVGKPELADHIGVSTRTVDRWVEQGLPHGDCWRYVGSRRKYKEQAVLRWLDDCDA